MLQQDTLKLYMQALRKTPVRRLIDSDNRAFFQNVKMKNRFHDLNDPLPTQNLLLSRHQAINNLSLKTFFRAPAGQGHIFEDTCHMDHHAPHLMAKLDFWSKQLSINTSGSYCERLVFILTCASCHLVVNLIFSLS